MPSFNRVISVLYSTMDIVITFQTRSRSCLCYCVLQTDTPFSDGVLFYTLIDAYTNSGMQALFLSHLRGPGYEAIRLWAYNSHGTSMVTILITHTLW